MNKSSLPLAFVILCLTGLNGFVEGYKQELWLYSENGAEIYFDKGVADLEPYAASLGHDQRFCLRGLWYSYSETNYTMFDRTIGGTYEGTGDELFCGRQNTIVFKSLRYQGAAETTVDALSMYTQEVWMGEVTLITAQTQTGMSLPTYSYGITGKSDWTIYEGKNLDGRSVCYTGAPEGGYFHSASGMGPINLVGSVKKGCN